MISINSNEIYNNILGPKYYEPKFILNFEFLKKSNYLLKKLDSNISYEIKDGPFGSDLLSSEYTSKGFPLIRVGNIANGHTIIDNLAFISNRKT